ncbi:hypothetical protein Q1695_013369 [Nippostrongylus brasiliensis]|nr:hypothetical protein Q1695_013369 [Nippostrongylus brasiliensis]
MGGASVTVGGAERDDGDGVMPVTPYCALQADMSTQLRGSRPNQERRNARERNRVHQVNHGFDLLRTRVPKAVINKKLSKADTLREAARYIQYLQSLLHTDGAVSQTGYPTPSCSMNSAMYSQSEMEFDVYFPSSSNSIASQHTSPVHSMYGSQMPPPSTTPGGRQFP